MRATMGFKTIKECGFNRELECGLEGGVSKRETLTQTRNFVSVKFHIHIFNSKVMVKNIIKSDILSKINSQCIFF